jgi:integrase
MSSTQTVRLCGLDLNLAAALILRSHPRRIFKHTLRHTSGTLLNANGENAKVVLELLRHASMKVTTDVYMQAVNIQKREAHSKLVRMVLEKTASQA